MNTRAFLASISICISVVAFASPLQSQYRTEYVGIYGIVERIAFEPNEESSQRIKIYGAFTVPLPMSSFQRRPVQRGYLYFAMVPGMEAATKKEWADLLVVAGTGLGIGFGQYWVKSADPTSNTHSALDVKVHGENEAGLPEPYPPSLSSGIVKMDKYENEPEILAQLQEALRSL